MAMCSPVQELITCDICMEIYTDPKILKCLHTFCLECITKIKNDTKVECPKCRQVTKLDEIQQDFKTQSLIDLNMEKWGNTKEVFSSSDKGSKHCDMCKVWEKPTQSQCMDCNQFMCGDCEKAHRGSVVSKNHNIVTNVDRIKSLHGFLSQNRVELEEDTQNIQKKSDDIVKCIHRMMKTEDEQLALVRKYKEERFKEIEDHHNRLEEDIKTANGEIIDALTSTKYKCDQLKENIQSKIEFLTETMKNEDIFSLTEIVSGLDGTLREKIDAFKGNLDNTNTNVESPVTIEKGETLNLENCTKVVVSPTEFSNSTQCEDLMLIDFGPALGTHYPKLVHNSFRQEKSISMDGSPVAFSIIKDQLWVADYEHGIFIYNKNLERVKEIRNENINSCCGLTSVDNGDSIIIACSSGNGLIQIDTTGNYQSKVACGSFADVHCYKGKVYGLEHKTCSLVVLEQNDNTWSNVEKYNLEGVNGSRWDKLHVCSFGIYTSMYYSHNVSVYNLSGEFQYEASKRDSDEVDNLQGPVICDVDSEGNALVCEYDDNRVLVYVMQHQWKTLPLKVQMERPLYCTVDFQTSNLWLITDVPKRLCRYTWT